MENPEIVEKRENENGQVIYEKWSDGYWKITRYDNNGNLIFRLCSTGSFGYCEYDKDNKIIFKASDEGYQEGAAQPIFIDKVDKSKKI